MTRGMYAGSFDPITRGHFDIVKQALMLFDEVAIAIGVNPKKTGMFSQMKRNELIWMAAEEEKIDLHRITVSAYSGSLMTQARDIKADAIVRGLRQVSDFNDEFALHGILQRSIDIPVTYLICRQDFLHVSSSTAKELVTLGEPVDWLVHDCVHDALIQVRDSQSA